MNLSKRARIAELCDRILAAAPIGSKLSGETVQNHDLQTVIRYSISCPETTGHQAEEWTYSAGLECEEALRLILGDVIGCYGAHDLAILPSNVQDWGLHEYRIAVRVALSNYAEPCHTIDVREWLEQKDRNVIGQLVRDALESLRVDHLVRQLMDEKWVLA